MNLFAQVSVGRRNSFRACTLQKRQQNNCRQNEKQPLIKHVFVRQNISCPSHISSKRVFTNAYCWCGKYGWAGHVFSLFVLFSVSSEWTIAILWADLLIERQMLVCYLLRFRKEGEIYPLDLSRSAWWLYTTIVSDPFFFAFSQQQTSIHITWRFLLSVYAGLKLTPFLCKTWLFKFKTPERTGERKIVLSFLCSFSLQSLWSRLQIQCWNVRHNN